MTLSDIAAFANRAPVQPRPKPLDCKQDGKHLVDAQFWRCIKCNEPIAVMSSALA